ncbi:hypothetical protein Zm00014a_042203 [Zea mays]|uniref:Uncharacterized protein n=1 Tax=Zea mays TaxID=4577 RepID=A0A3L6E0G8_MAIZE|nr:hypothetical protein Zm00014a_042203 [Zea mays]
MYHHLEILFLPRRDTMHCIDD